MQAVGEVASLLLIVSRLKVIEWGWETPINNREDLLHYLWNSLGGTCRPFEMLFCFFRSQSVVLVQRKVAMNSAKSPNCCLVCLETLAIMTFKRPCQPLVPDSTSISNTSNPSNKLQSCNYHAIKLTDTDDFEPRMRINLLVIYGK